MNFTMSEEEKKKNRIECISHSNPWVLESTLTLDEKNHLLEVMCELNLIWFKHYVKIENIYDNICNIKKYLMLQQIFLHYYLMDKAENRFRDPYLKNKGIFGGFYKINRYLDFINPTLFSFKPNIRRSVYFIDESHKDVLGYTQEKLKNIPKPICKKFGGWEHNFCETSFTDIKNEDDWWFEEDDLSQYNPLCIEVFLSNPMCVMQTFKDNFQIAISLKINKTTNIFPYKKFCENCLCNNENNCLYSQTNYKLFCRAEEGRPNNFKESLKNCIIMLEKEIEKIN